MVNPIRHVVTRVARNKGLVVKSGRMLLENGKHIVTELGIHYTGEGLKEAGRSIANPERLASNAAKASTIGK
ncbi:MAG: hypothetical protein P0S94_04030, partial [Simkaniaceae bacterium]|nr:hypothetical protein [Simkaniaceae bacterium]